MKSGMQWPIGIVAILASSVVANLAFMRVANSDPAFAVEPDYYQRAVAYDTAMHEAQLSNALQWTAQVSIQVVDEARGEVRVELRDRNGAPILADSARADAFYIARANDVSRTILAPDSRRGVGFYIASIPVQHRGQWEVRIDARRGSEHFVMAVRTDVLPLGNAQSVAPTSDSVSGPPL